MDLSRTLGNLLPLLCLIVLPLAGCSAARSVPMDTREAIAQGKVREFLQITEARAVEAEKNAQLGWFETRSWGEASSYYSAAARAASSSGQLQRALHFAEKALETAGKAQNLTSRARAMFWLASVHNSLRQFARSKEWMNEGVEVAKQIPDSWSRSTWEAAFYRLLGNESLRRGDLQDAIEYLSSALQINQSNLTRFQTRRGWITEWGPIDPWQAEVLASSNSLATAYRRAGRVEDAKDIFENGLAFIRAHRLNSPTEGDFFRGLGEIYLSQRNYTRALENFLSGLAVAERQQRPILISATSVRIGDIYRRTGKPDDAIPHYQRAIHHTESTRSLLQSQENRQSFFEGGLGAYRNMVDVLLELGRVQDAFNYNERARSRAFLDVLGSKVQLARTDMVLERERALQARISVLRSMTEGRNASLSGSADLRQELAGTEKAYNDYLAKLRQENKEQASLMSVEPLTLKEVQERLDSGVTLLEYFVAANNVCLWIVEQGRVEFVRITIPRRQLVAKVTELRDKIYQFGEKDRFNALSQELHKLLIQPASPYIRGSELIIVPHDVLHYLPFQALQSSDGRYLIEKYPIYYLSSASLMQFTQEKRRGGTNDKVLAFGNPDLGDPEKDLEFAELEAKEVKAAYPDSRVYIRKEATEEKSKAFSSDQDILHFATHAELNEQDPLSSAILLAREGKEDGRLEVKEIFGMDLKANLVVLSGCETGLGKLSTGDELVGLTRAFIYAGTPSVVASLWKVDDSSTAYLMSSFYRNLKTMSKVEALRQAQLYLIKGERKSDLLTRRGVGGIGKLGETTSSALPASSSQPISTSHPYFWASFNLVGDGG